MSTFWLQQCASQLSNTFVQLKRDASSTFVSSCCKLLRQALTLPALKQVRVPFPLQCAASRPRAIDSRSKRSNNCRRTAQVVSPVLLFAELRDLLVPLAQARPQVDTAAFSPGDIAAIASFFAQTFIGCYRLYCFVLTQPRPQERSKIQQFLEQPYCLPFHGTVYTGALCCNFLQRACLACPWQRQIQCDDPTATFIAIVPQCTCSPSNRLAACAEESWLAKQQSDAEAKSAAEAKAEAEAEAAKAAAAEAEEAAAKAAVRCSCKCLRT